MSARRFASRPPPWPGRFTFNLSSKASPPPQVGRCGSGLEPGLPAQMRSLSGCSPLRQGAQFLPDARHRRRLPGVWRPSSPEHGGTAGRDAAPRRARLRVARSNPALSPTQASRPPPGPGPGLCRPAGRALGSSSCREGVRRDRTSSDTEAPTTAGEVYRLAPNTRLVLQFYVEDRVLEGLWANWRRVMRSLGRLAD